MMKEVEVDALALPWVNTRVVHLLLVCRLMTMVVGEGFKEELDPDGYDQLMYTQNAQTIEPFSSHIVPVKAGRAYMGEHIKSWYKPCKLKMALCHGFSLYRTCTHS